MSPVVITSSARIESARSDLERAAAPWVKRPGRLDELCLAGVVLAGALNAGELADQRHALVLATAVGCLESDYAFWQQVMERGATGANPRLFAYTLPNVVLGEIAIRFGLTGDQLCISAGRASALTGLAEGAALVASGEVDCALVLAIDPVGPALQRIYAGLGTTPIWDAAVGWRLQREGPGTRITSWRTDFLPQATVEWPEPDPLGALGVPLQPGTCASATCPSGYYAEVSLA